MSVSREQILEAIAAMPVMDVVKLIEEMEEKFNVSAAAVAVAGPAPAQAQAAAQEEKTEFTVKLASVGDKVPTIKAIRAITGLGLKEAKDLVEGAPSVIKENINKEEVEEIKKQIEAAGGTVEVV